MLELVKLRAENERLKLEVQASDKLAIEKMREVESYKELYELCADHMTELQRKLDIVELAEAKARMSEEKYTAVALHDTFNEFKMQMKIDKLTEALKFYGDISNFMTFDSLAAKDAGYIARRALEVVLDEEN